MIDLGVSNKKDTKISSYSASMHGVGGILYTICCVT